jgi:hypothetical protein
MANKILIVIGFFCIVSLTCFAQEKTEPFYLDISSSRQDKVAEVQLDMLGIHYADSYGKWSEIPLKIFNWKREEVISVNLQKSFGANYFKVPLTKLYSNWEMDKIYSCEMKDESGRKYSLLIRPVLPPKKQDPVIDIVVNPISFKCDDINSNLVEFYAEVTGGKAPYKANWYVLNGTRTKLLYQPKEQTIEKPGLTSVIEVDKNPVYYVMLVLIDACGGMQQKMVELTCKKDETGVNSVFVEPINTSTLQNLINIK